MVVAPLVEIRLDGDAVPSPQPHDLPREMARWVLGRVVG